MNIYIQRLSDIRDIFITANEFCKLDRIEIGGIKGSNNLSVVVVKEKKQLLYFKGRNLSRRITDALLEYQKLYSRWISIDFDPLDAESSTASFKKIQKDYQEKSDAIERSLAQIFTEAFDDCYSTAHCFQVLITTLLNFHSNFDNNFTVDRNGRNSIQQQNYKARDTREI